MRRLLGGGGGFIFKGSGFYQTDYRSEGYEAAAKADAKAPAPAEKTGSDSAAGSTACADCPNKE